MIYFKTLNEDKSLTPTTSSTNMSQTMNTTVNRTIVKMYKKTNCSYCDFMPSVEIANTPEHIEEQIIKFNAVEDATIDFIAFQRQISMLAKKTTCQCIFQSRTLQR